MSTTGHAKRITTGADRGNEGQRARSSALTAYTTPIARLLDPHCDLLLVGDSLGMVLYGLPTTVGVTLEMMIAHGQAVMRGVDHACVVVDLPFGSYQESKEQAFRSAARILKETGCDGVKLEGGAEMAETVAFLTARGIPVFGHVGLMPQLVNTTGGYRSLGRSDKEAGQDPPRRRRHRRCRRLCDRRRGHGRAAGPRDHRQPRRFPTIGIGASPACDGQVLVSDDMLGLFTDFKPRFVKHFAELAPLISEAAAAYAEEVKARTLSRPGAHVPAEELALEYIRSRRAFALEQIDRLAEILHLLRQRGMGIAAALDCSSWRRSRSAKKSSRNSAGRTPIVWSSSSAKYCRMRPTIAAFSSFEKTIFFTVSSLRTVVLANGSAKSIGPSMYLNCRRKAMRLRGQAPRQERR